jgi:RNA:NAD 2'-phosphotransferase (TPT1/KptA family)
MMILYHGTNEKSLPAILQQGIKPRADSAWHGQLATYDR